jgi:hypothetical protein
VYVMEILKHAESKENFNKCFFKFVKEKNVRMKVLKI